MLRHQVIPSERVFTVRVESLYLANTPYLEDRIYDLVAARRSSSTCRAVNFIDASALERPGGDG